MSEAAQARQYIYSRADLRFLVEPEAVGAVAIAPPDFSGDPHAGLIACLENLIQIERALFIVAKRGTPDDDRKTDLLAAHDAECHWASSFRVHIQIKEKADQFSKPARQQADN